MWRSLLCLVSASALVSAGNNTITQEVFFDIKITGKDNQTWEGRFVVGIFGDALPITALNFVSLAKGFKHGDETWHYKDTLVHRIVPDFLLQMGDVVYGDGRGGRSIYAPFFIDEAFIHSHRAAGYVAMANQGMDTNASQFYVILTRSRWLDQKNVVFGKVISGMATLKKIAEVEVDEEGEPKEQVVSVADSGVLPLDKPYDLTEEQLDSNEDIRSGPAAPDAV